MGSHERWTALLDILGRDGRLEVALAAAELSVSPATIRRDLDQLAGQQLLSRTRGGAAPASVAYDLPLRYKTGRQVDEKSRIGTAAAALVRPGSVVAVNGGTTTSETVRALVAASTNPDIEVVGDNPAFTVVTNALNIANDLAVRRTIKLVVTGGVARPSSYELIGPLAEPILARLHLDYAVIGVDGLNLDAGATAHHEGEAAVSAQMVDRATTVVVVADASKLGLRSFATICPLSRIDVLITDTSADSELVAAFSAADVRVIQA